MSPPAEPTHYAVEYIPRGWMVHTLTRVWTRWSDGSTSHSDTASIPCVFQDFTIAFDTMNVNIGATLEPHDDLVWRERQSKET